MCVCVCVCVWLAGWLVVFLARGRGGNLEVVGEGLGGWLVGW